MPPIRATSPFRKPAVARATICNAARQVGVNPQDRAEVLDLAAVAITRLTWRDSQVEDRHADPDSRISDPELMRANAATTRLTHSLLGLQSLNRLINPATRTSGLATPRPTGCSPALVAGPRLAAAGRRVHRLPEGPRPR
jgi:hypothetical protein